MIADAGVSSALSPLETVRKRPEAKACEHDPDHEEM
jgi:hypothetical protein